MFKTKDLSLSAYLKMKEFKIIDTEKQGRVVYFCFEDTPEIKTAKIEYFNNVGGFNSFSNSMKDLKTLIYN